MSGADITVCLAVKMARAHGVGVDEAFTALRTDARNSELHLVDLAAPVGGPLGEVLYSKTNELPRTRR